MLITYQQLHVIHVNFTTMVNGNIYINGEIGTFLDENGSVINQGVELIDVILQVKNQPKATSFTVYINSPGGYVDVGFEIYDYLKSLGKPIKTVGQGMVASIATVIYMAGDERQLKPNTQFLIHLPSGSIHGNSDEIETYSKYIKDIEKRVVKFYTTTTNLLESEITPLLQKETILTPDEAFKLGFATEKSIATQVVAYFDKPFKKEPMSKKQKGILSQIADILKGAKIENKIVFDAEQNELDFFDLADDATIGVGAKANYEGQAANGEYQVPSEEDPNIILTYVFENGELKNIIEPEVEVEVEDRAEEVEALKTKNEELEKQLAEMKVENKSYKLAINKIKMLQTEEFPKTETREKPVEKETVKNDVSSEVTNWKKNKQLKKIK